MWQNCRDQESRVVQLSVRADAQNARAMMKTTGITKRTIKKRVNWMLEKLYFCMYNHWQSMTSTGRKHTTNIN